MCHTYILWFTGHKVGTQILADDLIYPESVKAYFRSEQNIAFSTGEWKIAPLCLTLNKIKLEFQGI